MHLLQEGEYENPDQGRFSNVIAMNEEHKLSTVQ